MKPGCRSAFTLVEMLVSMFAATLVLLLGVASLQSTGDGYERSAGGVGAEREARAVLTQIAEDLSKAVARGGSDLKLEVEGEVWRRDIFGFLCLQPDEAQSEDERLGDLCAVVYYVRDLDIGGVTVPCLMRGFRGSKETFESIRMDRVESLYKGRSQDEPVAFGIVSFQVEPMSRQDGGDLVAWNPEVAFPLKPDLVKLRLVVARRELVSKLTNAEDWNSSPMLGRPEGLERSAELEVFEITKSFAHGS